MSAIKHWLRAVRRRLLLVRAVEAGLQAALWASLAALAVLALGWTGAGWAKRAFPSAHLVLVLLPAGWFIGFSARLLAGIHLRCAASFADGAADLKERVATAIEREADEPRVSGVSALQIKDAEAHIEGLLPRQLHYRRTMARRARFVAAGALLLTALAFIPRPTLETGAGRPGPQEGAEKINAAARKLKTSDNVPAGARESIRQACTLAQ
ncbi:MAG: hypothetical protein QGD94_03770, partial [Planctomycetia bacterium]|nr:hypothetical protein [Planctomycetia bacterium]